MIKQIDGGQPVFVPTFSLMNLLLASWNLFNNGWLVKYRWSGREGAPSWKREVNNSYAGLPASVRWATLVLTVILHFFHAQIGLLVEVFIVLFFPRITATKLLEEKSVWRSIVFQ